MARGGYRPNSGPQKGAKYKPRQSKPKPEDVLMNAMMGAAKKQIKQKRARPPKPNPPQSLSGKAPVLSLEDAKQAAAENLDPLSYMLKVMNDTSEDKNRRDRMAIAAAPFCHPRKGEGVGKKEEKESRAKTAGAGRFASMSDRLKVVK